MQRGFACHHDQGTITKYLDLKPSCDIMLQAERAAFQDTDELPLVREESEAIAAAAVEARGRGRRTYVLRPVDGRLRYTRGGREARTDEGQAVQDADVELDALSLHLATAWL